MTLMPPYYSVLTAASVARFFKAGLLASLPPLFFWSSPALSKPEKGVKVEVIMSETLPLVEEVFLTGSVVSPKVAKLSVQLSGQVSHLQVDLGQLIKAGSEVLRLDSELERLALEETRAATNKARLELEDVQRRLVDAKRLLTRKGISANQVELLKTEVLTDQAELTRMQAQQRLVEARLNKYSVKAPFDGVVSQKFTEVGEWLNPGTPVIELTVVNGLVIDFQLPQAFREKLNEQTEVAVSFNDGLPYPAEVVWLMPVANHQSRTMQLRTRLVEEPKGSVNATRDRGLIVPGMSARAVLRFSSGQQGVAVPRDALIRHSDGRMTVWVVNREGQNTTVSERMVEAGLKFRGRVAVTGLKAGEQVVIKGNESLRNGMRVHVQPFTVSEKD